MNGYIVLDDTVEDSPFDIDDVRYMLRVDYDEDEEDELIEQYVKSAMGYFESQSGGYLPQAKIVQSSFRHWPRSNYLLLPAKPLVEVMEFVYFTADGEQVLDDETYMAFQATGSGAGQIRMINGHKWPDVTLVPPFMHVRYKAGFMSLPDDVRQCISLLVGHFYENRQPVFVPSEDRGSGRIAELPHGVAEVMERYFRLGSAR